VREKYCSGWKNKLKSTDYKPDEQGYTAVFKQIVILIFHVSNGMGDVSCKMHAGADMMTVLGLLATASLLLGHLLVGWSCILKVTYT
jgi:hypothetical protein